MNFLAHLALAGPKTGLLLGGFLGDFVKGRLENQFNAEVERGIRLHRAIDQYTDTHPKVKESYARFEPKFRRYAGIITDIAFDYLLAKNWSRYYNEPLNSFSIRTLEKLIAHKNVLPERAFQNALRMHANNSLAHHGELAFIERSLTNLSGRLKRSNPLIEAYSHCQEQLPGLLNDFFVFYPELINFSEAWKHSH